MMSSDGWPLLIYFLLLMLIAVVIESLVVAFLINVISRSPLHLLLWSSAVVGCLAFVACFAFMLFVPGQFTSYNGEPTSFKAWLVHNQLEFYGVTVLTSVTIWQFIVRRRNRNGESRT